MTSRAPEPNSSGVGKRTVRGRKAASSKIASRKSPRGDLSIADALKRLKKAQLREPFEFWSGGDASEMPAKVGDVRSALEGWMSEPAGAVERAAGARVTTWGQSLPSNGSSSSAVPSKTAPEPTTSP